VAKVPRADPARPLTKAWALLVEKRGKMQRQPENSASGVTFRRGGLLVVLTRFVHQHFLLILIGAYALSALFPRLGLALREVQLGNVTWPDGSQTNLSLALLMLSFLLFNAGVAIRVEELVVLRRRPAVPIAGFAANTLVPIALIVSLLGVMQLWHSSDELQNLLVGLALIISMPIAGSSTAWAQNADGNISLSLGLVLLSTLLSPVTVPAVLHLFSYLTENDYSEDLQQLASQGTGGFLMLTIVLPSLAGIIVHLVCGEAKLHSLRVVLKLANYAILLLLNYSNASTALPQAFGNPDVDYLLFIGGTTFVLCIAAYGTGWLLSRWLKVNKPDQASLIFGLGMHNTGTGLVLATSELSAHPPVLLPLIFYTLMQQVIAAVIDRRLFITDDESE
jgi:BASS family bile acid:Na+ symporter